MTYVPSPETLHSRNSNSSQSLSTFPELTGFLADTEHIQSGQNLLGRVSGCRDIRVLVELTYQAFA